MPGKPQLSLIVPCYNEEANIRVFFDAACSCFDAAGITLECVFVNDGSQDDTADVLRALVEENRGVRMVQAISFTRNFGKESALYAGLQAARGQVIGLIDADMQQRPEDALRMYRMLLEHPECDSVAACQVNRKEPFMLRVFKRAFYRTFNGVSDDIDIPANVSDFRVFRRDVADALLAMPEVDRFSKGLFAWVGFTTLEMPYEPDARNSGTTKWSFHKLFKYAMGGIFSFTTWPLKIAVWAGALASLVALVYLVMVVCEYFFIGIAVSGYATLVCLVLLFGGLQLVVLGAIGEYLARDYIENKHRPIYLARERLDTEGESVK